MGQLSEVLAVLRANAGELDRMYGVRNLAVFGSVARGQATAHSDVDIVADVPLSVDVLKLMEIELHLRRLLNTEVDVVPRGEIRRELRDRVLSESVPV